MTNITLDAKVPEIKLESEITGGDYSEELSESSEITLNATRGVVESRNDNGVAQLSAAGIFCNNAGTNGMPVSTGYIHKGAVVGLGFGNLPKNTWQMNGTDSVLAGVYGRAHNTGTAPDFGGFFYNLYAGGLTLGRKCVSGSNQTVYLNREDTAIIGYTSDTSIVYLPPNPIEGQVVYVKQWWTGTMRVRPRSGQHIYDDSSENEYYDFGEGRGGIFIFTIGYITKNKVTTKVEAWLVNAFKW